eukprot:Gb_11324 [translate_table: standard]
MEKLVARTQHRRPRHMKGLKPTKQQILKEIEEETEDEMQHLGQLDISDDSFAEQYTSFYESGLSLPLNESKAYNKVKLSTQQNLSVQHQESFLSEERDSNMSTNGAMETTKDNGAPSEQV